MRSKRLELQEALKKQKPSTTKRQETLQNQRPSTAKPHSASVNNGRLANEVVTDAVDERLNTVTLEEQTLSTAKSYSASINGRKAKEVLTDAVGERANGKRAKKIVTDAVDERLNTFALEKQTSSATKSRSEFVNGRRAKEVVTNAVDERPMVVAPKKQSSSTRKPHISFIIGRRANKIVINAVDERPNAVALEKQMSSTAKPCSAIDNGSWANEIVSIAADARLNTFALKKQRLSTTKPCSAFVNGIRANEIVTDPVDERLNAVSNILDTGYNITDEDTDTLDTYSDIRDKDADVLDADGDSDVQNVEDQSLATNSDEDADILDMGGDSDYQIVEDHLLPNNSDEDADILDVGGDNDYQTVEDQSLPSDSDKEADILDADGDSDYQIVEDQSLLTNSEKVAGSSRKRKHDIVQRQVTGPHRESNGANCNGQLSTCRPSGTRIPIVFDKYGRPCDVGSEEFATDIGRIVRAHCRPAIESWKIVPNSIKDNIWKDISVKYVVPYIYKPNILSRANLCWKRWKTRLRLEMDKHETVAERKFNMPYRFIKKRQDWESFVDFCDTDEDRKRRASGKKAREAIEFMQSCGRKGIHRKIYNLEKESPTGEVTRAAIFVDTHISKDINDPKMRLVRELVEANPDGQKDIDNDAVALVYGRDRKGLVRGMGGGVSRTVVRASAASVETLRKVQLENKSLQSHIHLLQTQFGTHTPSHTFTPSNQSVSHTQNRASTPSNQSVSHIQNRTSTPSNQSASQAPSASNLPARSRLSPSASNLPACSRSAPDVSNLPARSCLAPPVSNLPARSCLAPPVSNLAASSCFIKNFKGRTIALGSINAADPPMEHVYSLILEEIFDRDADLFDKDGKLGDILIGGVINWPKACVESNLPDSSCFIRNFKRRIIAFGSLNTTDPPMEHVYSVIVKEIYDKDAELFYEDGKLGDIMIGGLINWPKACIEPCRQ